MLRDWSLTDGYAWANPTYVGNSSKAAKLEFRVGVRELDRTELADAQPGQRQTERRPILGFSETFLRQPRPFYCAII
jgi:hypothetical protein